MTETPEYLDVGYITETLLNNLYGYGDNIDTTAGHIAGKVILHGHVVVVNIV